MTMGCSDCTRHWPQRECPWRFLHSCHVCVSTNAAATCTNAGGKIATFKDQYQQWMVESILFPNSTAGTADAYWVGNVYKATEYDYTYDNVTWFWRDTFQQIGPFPSANSTALYSRWGAGEPRPPGTGSNWCARAVRGLAFDTVGPWPEYERRPGNMSVWGWGVLWCSTTEAFICELKCKQAVPLHRYCTPSHLQFIGGGRRPRLHRAPERAGPGCCVQIRPAHHDRRLHHGHHQPRHLPRLACRWPVRPSPTSPPGTT
jgi:hypothetical protein